MNHHKSFSKGPIIGILGWEDAANEKLYGSLARPETFDFPVLFKRVKGACFETIIAHPSTKVLEAMIVAAREMERDGVSAITTSCGFNAIFQKELAEAVKVPVFASALILVPMVYAMLGAQKKVGIFTANQNYLTQAHLQRAGVSETVPVCTYGLENTTMYQYICLGPRSTHGKEGEFRDEVRKIAMTLVEANTDVGAIVLECTTLHPFADEIRKTTGLPVFDIVSLTNFIMRCCPQMMP